MATIKSFTSLEQSKTLAKILPIESADMREEWRDIEGYEGLYMVSNFGRVVSFQGCNPRIMKLGMTHKGYQCVGLQKNKQHKTIVVHRLVAKAFIPNPDNLPQVNHKDECKTNNRVDNLEWCTAKYNDGAIKEAFIAHKDEDKHLKATLERIFPELRKSEDEKMREMAIKAVYAPEAQSCIKSWGINPDDVIAWLEKQGEQKLTDKVEPKFKVGDWIVSNVSHEDYRICKILKIENGEYSIESIYGYQGHNNFKTFDKDYHLWNINEAKDGDVLAFYSEYRGNKMVQVGIIEKYVGQHGGCSNTFQVYVGLNWDNDLQIGKYMGCSDIRPATKEQRDILMREMTDAGYQWNKEELKLKRIEQNSNWSKEDEHRVSDTIYFLDTAKKHYANTEELDACIDWLKSLKDRVQPEQEWSEEDITVLKNLIYALANDRIGNNRDEYVDWLKFLKDRYTWKPSEAQLEALDSTTENCAYSEYQDCLRELIGQLKKLKEK